MNGAKESESRAVSPTVSPAGAAFPIQTPPPSPTTLYNAMRLGLIQGVKQVPSELVKHAVNVYGLGRSSFHTNNTDASIKEYMAESKMNETRMKRNAQKEAMDAAIQQEVERHKRERQILEQREASERTMAQTRHQQQIAAVIKSQRNMFERTLKARITLKEKRNAERLRRAEGAARLAAYWKKFQQEQQGQIPDFGVLHAPKKHELEGGMRAKKRRVRNTRKIYRRRY